MGDDARERPLFSVGDDVYRWDDVVRLALSSGDWAEIAAEARTGIAALAELERRGEAPGSDALASAEREFRYARGLLAGEELEAWLDVHGLSVEAWEGYLRRELARERLPDAGADVTDAEVDACAWAEGVCSGTLDEVARTLAAFAAVAPGLPLEQLEDAFDEFSRQAATEEAIAREIEGNRLEWLRLRYDAVGFADEDAAREAALCVRSDGDPLAEVAGRAGAAVEERADWLDEVDPELATRFLAADPGDLVGPVRVDDRFVLAHVRGKTPPDADDEDVRARAAWAVADRAVTRQVDERVVWLEPL